MFILFLVISPIILTANPGPGNGCLSTTIVDKPNLRPTSLTSSLNKFLNGSKSFNFISLGNPPTLWCDLIVTAGPCSDPPDSITSGYKVP